MTARRDDGRRGHPRSRATVYAGVGAAAVVLALGAGARLLGGDGPQAAQRPSAAPSAAPSEQAGTASDTPGLTLGAAALSVEGDRLQVSAPLHNGEADDVVLTSLDGLPAGVRPQLPDGGLALPAHGSATLTLAWDGPDCGTAAPERVLGDVGWAGRTADGEATRGPLATGPIEHVL
ncbi:hypothetical protein G9H71_22020, partial [Motilibacter sp. E257]